MNGDHLPDREDATAAEISSWQLLNTQYNSVSTRNLRGLPFVKNKPAVCNCYRVGFVEHILIAIFKCVWGIGHRIHEMRMLRPAGCDSKTCTHPGVVQGGKTVLKGDR